MLIEGLRWWEMGRKGEMVEEEEEDEGSRQSETEMLKEEGGGGAYFVDVIAVEAISSVCVCLCVSCSISPIHTLAAPFHLSLSAPELQGEGREGGGPT